MGPNTAIQINPVLLILAGSVIMLLIGYFGLRLMPKLLRTWRGRTIRTWVAEALQSADPLRRRMAVGRLASQRGRGDDAQVVTALMQAMEDSDENVRTAALEVLLSLAGRDPAVGSLLASVAQTDPSATVRLHAIHGMVRLIPLSPSTVTVLLEALRHDSSPAVRLQVVRILERQETVDAIPAAPLIQALGDENSAVRQAVTAVLDRQARSRSDILPALAQVIRYGSQHARRLQAMRIVQAVGTPAPEMLDACLHVLWSAKGSLRDQAATTLAHLARQDPAALDWLVEAARSSEHHPRRLRLFAVFKEVGQGTVGVVATLLEALASTDDVRRPGQRNLLSLSEAAQATLRALDFQDSEAVRLLLEGLRGETGPLVQEILRGIRPTPALLQGLQEMLTTDTPRMRRMAATILVAWGHAAPEMIDYLLSTLQDPVSRDAMLDLLAQLVHSDPALLARIGTRLNHADPRIRQETVALLEHLGQQQGLVVTPYLLQVLGDLEVQVREGAMDALLALHPDGKTLARTLLEFLPAAEPRACEGATELLAELARRSTMVLGFLKVSLQHPRATVRAGVVNALGQVGEAESVSMLMGALSDTRTQVRLQAVQALASLVSRFPEARHGLERALEDRNGYVREAAIRALVQANEPAPPHLIARLIQALNDESALVRQTTTRALGQLGRADDENLVDALTRALQDPDEDVRRAAAATLDQVMMNTSPA